ncbi:nibrin isoform X2 [Mixophyes fleayi]|uniref:nibrin isoform X2 n=1 Tax=Mixophyes fleayi TaxID=3061075 RepID=UPI003F4DC57C
MWTLGKESGGGQIYHFLTSTDYVVGRKNCAVLIEDDQSISRAHAAFTVSHSLSSLGHPDVIPFLTIKDSSKYGTFINGEKMGNGSSRDLKSGDKITFGVYNSKFRVMYEPLVACSSCLNASEKSSVTQAVLSLGGHVVNNWTEKCTHLVMTSVKVTIKTICALICGRSIIKPEYFNEMITSIQQKQPLPTLTSFMPVIDEPSLQSESLDLSENARRKTIFKDKTFLFLTAKQHKKLSPAVQFGRGKAKLLTGEADNQSLLENPNTCVIDVGMTESQLSESQSIPTWISSALDILTSKGLRCIPEAEIGLAVIYMSTEIYCNPCSAKRETRSRNNIVGSTLSLSMAVDETVLPATTFNTTAYVANTEPQDPTDNRMDMSGVREVKETPKSSGRSRKRDVLVEEDREPNIGGDCKAVLFQEHQTTAEKRTRRVSQIEMSASNREKTSQKMQPSNKIQSYFQPIAKKRNRDEDDDCETSTTKLARVENANSLCSKPVKDLCPSKETAAERLLTNAVDPDFDLEPVVLSSEKPGISNNGGVEASRASLAKDASVKKRKEPDTVVEESDLSNEEDGDDEIHQNNPKSSVKKVKRLRVESEDELGEDLKTGSQDRRDRTAPPPQSVQKVLTEPDVKQEPESQYEHSKMTFKPKAEDDDDSVPSNLLMLEFRSLVVSRPSRNSQSTANTNQGNGLNFKKFRKIAYPGAGSFPNIIGGSDLIAHDKKKNSELEQWLRQEMEEQTQQAREQSLAEDLFRYNPKMVKRRR